MAAAAAHSSSLAGVAFGAPNSPAANETAAEQLPLGEWVEREVQAALDSIESDKDYDAAVQRIAEVRDVAIAFADEKELDALVPAERAWRLLSLIETSGADDRVALVRKLLEHPRFADELAFTVGERDDVAQVFAVATRLVDNYSDRIEEFAALAAAICVVHDGAFSFRVNENTAVASPPHEIFEYFANNARKLRYDPRELPAELLIFVVDASCEVRELRWALNRYNRSVDVGDRYFEIRYDFNHLERGTMKSVTASGSFTLPSILEHGGVCADQAFYAKSIGKAFGVPSVYVTGQSANMGHAWVGYLRTTSSRAWWDLESGRYDEYKESRGTVRHPQTRQEISDNELSLIAGMSLEKRADRRAAQAALGAAIRIGELREAGEELPSERPAEVASPRRRNPPPAREVSVAAEMQLLRAGLERAPSKPAGWEHVTRRAREGALDKEELNAWFKALDRLAGRRYPFFVVEWVLDVVPGLPDADSRHNAYEWAFGEYRRMSHLGSMIRFHQGKMWEAEGDRNKAYLAYFDIVENYANDSPWVVTALHQIERMLLAVGRQDAIVDVYERAFRKMRRPEIRVAGVFHMASQWYRVGYRLAYWYGQTGQENKGRSVFEKIAPPK